MPGSLESSSHIMVGPSVATQLPESAVSNDKTVGKVREEGGLVDKKRLKGCQPVKMVGLTACCDREHPKQHLRRKARK